MAVPAEPAANIKKPKTSGKVLKDTSQGGIYDIPPATWIKEELIKFGVVGTKNVKAPDLKGDIHPIFAREKFPEMKDERYDILGQSFILATKMLEFGMPYLATFLPETKLQAENAPPRGEGVSGFGHGLEEDIYGFDGDGDDFDLELEMELEAFRNFAIVAQVTDPSEAQIETARAELLEITKGTEWRESGSMFEKHGWLGITKSSFPRPEVGEWEPPDEISESDDALQAEGASRRKNTIGLAAQYVDSMLLAPANSETFLFAAFHAAHTMVHEIGHVVYWQNFEHWNDEWAEPAVGEDCCHELGQAFIAYIFGGWVPEPILQGNRVIFTTGMRWVKQLRRPLPRPEWIIEYSMPFSSVQRIMSQQAWDTMPAASVLRPETPFQSGKHARTAVCQKSKVGAGIWTWSGDGPRNHRFSEDVESFKVPRGDGHQQMKSLPRGMPPFGFVDPDWTDGQDSSPIENSKEVGPAFGTERAEIVVQQPKERGAIDYSQWSMPGLIRLCQIRRLEWEGPRSLLVRRIELNDKEQALVAESQLHSRR